MLWELTQGELGKAPSAVTDSLPSTLPDTSVADEAGPSSARLDDSEEEEDLEEMKERLSALRS